MTGRLVAVAVLATVVAAIAAGATTHMLNITREQAFAAKAPDLMDGVHAMQSALNSAPATGQSIPEHLRNCLAAVAAYNQAAAGAGPYLPAGLPQQLTDQECQP